MCIFDDLEELMRTTEPYSRERTEGLRVIFADLFGVNELFDPPAEDEAELNGRHHHPQGR